MILDLDEIKIRTYKLTILLKTGGNDQKGRMHVALVFFYTMPSLFIHLFTRRNILASMSCGGRYYKPVSHFRLKQKMLKV